MNAKEFHIETLKAWVRSTEVEIQEHRSLERHHRKVAEIAEEKVIRLRSWLAEALEATDD